MDPDKAECWDDLVLHWLIIWHIYIVYSLVTSIFIHKLETKQNPVGFVIFIIYFEICRDFKNGTGGTDDHYIDGNNYSDNYTIANHNQIIYHLYLSSHTPWLIVHVAKEKNCMKH